MNSQLCPCGSTKHYQDCCSNLVEHKHTPKNPEQLMRSRYTAYTLHDCHYLLTTWHHSTRPTDINSDELAKTKWTQLYIVNTKQGLKHDVNNITGTVEFVAYFLNKTSYEKLHEISYFKKEDNKWFYVDGKIITDSSFKPRRNSPCYCGSAKKYKQCCLIK